ncbi:MAG: MerR family transcriptional regulator [Rhodospirillaceae bacterium]|nr:MerR family transcriptional regulator [Rhodospirillaceae bacterium]
MRPIGAASTMSGVNIETIRYYEREGIIPLADRTPSGRRLYGDADIARLRFVKRCRDLGFSVPDIRTLLELSAGNGASCADVKALGERHLHGVRRKLDELGKLERALAELVRRCDTGRTDCPMLERFLADSDA